MKKLLLIALVALSLTALVGIGASGAGGNIAGAAAPKATPIVYQMQPGQSVVDYAELTALREWQVFVVANTSTSAGRVSASITDCCITGDTMIGLMLGPGLTLQFDYATSPDSVILGPQPLAARGLALIITGYINCPGGFPAGYDYTIRL